MKLVALLCVLELPLFACAWYARNQDATGAAGGVLWLLAFSVFALAVFVTGAWYEQHGLRARGRASVEVLGSLAAGRSDSGPPHTGRQDAA